MTGSKPYLIRALYEWMTDGQLTPLLLVDASGDGLQVPSGSVVDGKLVFNISFSATDNLELANEWISFSARFKGIKENILVPVSAVIAIYARENGEGMSFEVGPIPEPDPKPADVGIDLKAPKDRKPADKGPGLKLVK